MNDIVKSFPGVLANDRVSFRLKPGTVHALLGENGAGKSTLMNVLSGIYRPEEGDIFVKGKRVEIRSPREANNLGISMVHQHFALVPPFTVCENVALGRDDVGTLTLRIEHLAEKIREMGDLFGLKLDPFAKVSDLSVGERQRVEIVKALLRGADILILDEPTSVLTPQEAEGLFKTMASFKPAGKSVVFITHKLNEALAISDEVTVMRAGRSVATVAKDETSKSELVRLMFGEETHREQVDQGVPRTSGRPILEVCSVSASGDEGVETLKDLNLLVSTGEILGIAGVDGNGQKELAEILTGLRRVRRGKITIGGNDLTNRPPFEFHRAGVAYITDERMVEGTIPTLDICRNMVLKSFMEEPLAGRFFIRPRTMEDYARRLVQEYSIKTPDIFQKAETLSGGNLQKLVVAREMSSDPRVLIANKPTQGLDARTTDYIRAKLREQAAKGTAVLLISTELDEILEVSDRIAVIYEGKIVGELDAKTASKEELGYLMAGSRQMLVR